MYTYELERIWRKFHMGVQQRDNVAQILFLFVMQAVMETLKQILPSNTKP